MNSVIADVTDVSIRNSWMSRLDGVVSAAFIIGPAIGGILSKVNYHFPLYNEYIMYYIDIALVLYLVLLWLLLSFSLKNLILEKLVLMLHVFVYLLIIIIADKKEEKLRVKPRVTLLMALCFIVEFCVRWTSNAFNSRYGFYLADKFGTSADGFS